MITIGISARLYEFHKEATDPLPIPEVVPFSSKAVPSNIAVQDAKKGSKKRRKGRPHWFAVVTDYDDDDDEKVDGSNLVCVSTSV
jgi:hypothetical protein